MEENFHLENCENFLFKNAENYWSKVHWKDGKFMEV